VSREWSGPKCWAIGALGASVVYIGVVLFFILTGGR
jgi:hypothetical protein